MNDNIQHVGAQSAKLGERGETVDEENDKLFLNHCQENSKEKETEKEKDATGINLTQAILYYNAMVYQTQIQYLTTPKYISLN